MSKNIETKLLCLHSGRILFIKLSLSASSFKVLETLAEPSDNSIIKETNPFGVASFFIASKIEE